MSPPRLMRRRGRLRSILIALLLKQCFLCCASSITAEPALQLRGKAYNRLAYSSGMVVESLLTDSSFFYPKPKRSVDSEGYSLGYYVAAATSKQAHRALDLKSASERAIDLRAAQESPMDTRW